MPRRNQSAATPAPEPEVVGQEVQAEAAMQEDSAASTPPMKIDVRITSTRNVFEDNTRAIASVVLGDCFVIKGLRVVKGENSLFCSMPSRHLRNGEFAEVCHPITPEFAQQLSASVLGEYQVYLAQQMAESQELPHVYESEQPSAPTPELEMEAAL